MIIGVTGSFGSGKTTVAGIFKSFGAKLIDADKIAHRIIKPGSKVYKKIIAAFGKDILKDNKTIDRDKLAHLVFNNKSLLRTLNKITHPRIISLIKGQIRADRSKIIVLDAPLLIEAGLGDWVDKIIVVKLSRAQQIQRLLNKPYLTKSEVSKRIAAQMPLRKKMRLADFIINNNGTIKATKRQVEKIFKKLIGG